MPLAGGPQGSHDGASGSGMAVAKEERWRERQAWFLTPKCSTLYSLTGRSKVHGSAWNLYIWEAPIQEKYAKLYHLCRLLKEINKLQIFKSWQILWILENLESPVKYFYRFFNCVLITTWNGRFGDISFGKNRKVNVFSVVGLIEIRLLVIFYSCF